jgi:hypothetical protein
LWVDKHDSDTPVIKDQSPLLVLPLVR